MPTRESNIKEGVEDQLKIEEQSGPNLCTGVPMTTDQVQSIIEERETISVKDSTPLNF